MKFVFCFCLCAILVSIPLFFNQTRQSKITIDKIQQQLEFEPEKLHDAIIRIYVDRRIKMHDGELSGCSVKNCVITQKTSAQNLSDALLLLPDSPVPLNPVDSQIWIMVLMESPINTPNLEHWNIMINYTASYRHDAEFLMPYGLVKKSKIGIVVDGIDQKKSKQVLWIASNCFTPNNRSQLVDKLAKYINVTVFGKCGVGQISQQQMRFNMQHVYKFYLAFENSNCRDYITEKFYNLLANGILPVVFGEKRKFYEKNAPPNSFIHVDDFPDVQTLARSAHEKQLGQFPVCDITIEQCKNKCCNLKAAVKKDVREVTRYLHYLDQNWTAYNAYFEWRSSYYLANSKFYCRLCKHLQVPKFKVYHSVEEWWHNGNDCSS